VQLAITLLISPIAWPSFVLPADLARLEQTALAVGDVGLVVLDPIGNHLGGADTDKEGAVRFAAQGLNRFADKHACVVFGVRHIGKSRENGALASVLGSTAWVDLPRCVLAFAADDEDPLRFHVEVVAGNRSGRGVGRVYRIELVDVGLLEPVTKAVPEGDSTKHVDDLLFNKQQRASKSQSARDLILDLLESEGDQESDTLDARVAREAGITAKTVRNLRGELKNEGLIKAVPVTNEAGAVDHWKVVRTAAPRPQ
jgi:AAA domain